MSVTTDAILCAYARAAEEHGVTLTYCRGDRYVSLNGNPGESIGEAFDPRCGAVELVELRDWLVRRFDLHFDGELIEPRRGDLIRFGHNGIVETFAVTHPDPNQQPFRSADECGMVLRIHSLLDEVQLQR